MQTQNGSPAMSVPVCLAPSHKSTHVEMRATTITLNFPLVDGPHLVTSPPIHVGDVAHFTDPKLMASMTFWYNYDSASNTLTFCSNELVSDDSPYITTTPNGASEVGHQHAYDNDRQACAGNTRWNFTTPLTPGLQQALQQTVRLANDAVIAEAKALGFTVIVRSPLPELPPADYERLCAVYHEGKFVEFYDPDKTYGTDYSLVHVDSFYHGTAVVPSGADFANVIGSTNDPKVQGYNSWISLWQAACNGGQTVHTCTSHGYPANVNCGASLLGGHVISGTQARVMPSGSYVMILPICHAHNNNDNIYMKALTHFSAVVLSNYLH